MKAVFLTRRNTRILFSLSFICSLLVARAQTSYTYFYVGTMQTYVVPACVPTLTIETWGAQGGQDLNVGYNTNFGGYASAVFTVTQGMVLNIYVGGQATSTLGGYNGGGNGYINPWNAGIGKGGGGASDVRIGGTGLANRVIVAGGGGGGGSDSGIWGNWVMGGAGGGLTGTQGVNYDGGCAGAQPGTQSSSGPGICNGVLNNNMNGGFGFGGDALPICGYGFGCGGGASSSNAGYGGGGGWYGGSAGSANFGGGGGSGYIISTASNGVFGTNVQSGHGLVRITQGYQLDLTPATTSCSPGGNASVTVSGGIAPFIYSWQPSGLSTATVTGLSAGIHSVTVSDGCASTTTTLSVTKTTTFAIASQTLCSGNSSTISLPAGNSYTWGPPATLSSTNTAVSVASPTTATSYTVVLTNPQNCSYTGNFQISVLPGATLSVNSATICAGQNATLAASANTGYTWSPGGTLNSTNAGTVIATPLVTTIYTLSSSNAAGCIATATSQVWVNATPTVAISNVTICVGKSATLAPSPAMSSYTWGPGASLNGTTTQSVIASPLITTHYTVGFTNSLSCTGSKTIEVAVSPTETISIPEFTNCAGQTITLASNSFTGVAYRWSGPLAFSAISQNTTITNATAAMSGAYNFSVVSAAGCTSQAVCDVTVFPVPSLTISSNAPVCAGTNLLLNVNNSGATNYTWTGPPPNSFSSVSQNTNIAMAGTADGGIYTVAASFLNGCTAAASSSLTVTPLPVTSIAYNDPVCLNTTLTLSGLGGGSYSWQGPDGFSSLAQNPSINNVQPVAAGIYTLIATLNSCTASATQSVTIYSLPVPNAANNSAICSNDQLQLNASAAVSHTWAGPASFTSNLQSPSITSASLANSGLYTVTVSDINTCQASATTSVTILPNPVISITGTNVCLNAPGTLTVTGGISWLWTGPAGFSSPLSNPTVAVVDNSTAGSYTVVVTAANTCTSGASATLSFIPLPVLAASSATVCFNQPATLSASGAATYTWTGPNGFLYAGNSPVISSANAVSAGIYTVLGQGANTCTMTSAASLTTMPLPVVSATGTIVCFKDLAPLASAGSTDVVSYSWYGPGGYTSAGQNTTVASATNVAPANYTVVVTALNSCTQQAVASLSTYALPLVTATPTLICRNEPFTLAAGGALNYSWSGPAGTGSGPTLLIASVNAASAGIYTVTGTDANNCSNVATAKIDTLPLPKISAAGSTVCIGNPATLIASGAVSYAWTGPAGYNAGGANAVIPAASSAATQIYSVVGTGVNSCTQIATVMLDTWPLPLPVITAPTRLCLNTSLVLQAAGAKTYTWTGPYSYSSTIKNVTIPLYNMKQAGTYSLNVTDSLGCKNFTTASVKIDPLPVGELLSSNRTNNCLPFCADYQLKSTGLSPIVSSSWIFNNKAFTGDTFSICMSKSSSNAVVGNVTDAIGCVNTLTFVVATHPSPVADFLYSPEKPIENLEPVVFNDNSTGEKLTKWNWFFVSNKGFLSSGQNTSYLFENAGTFPVALVVTNSWGCADTIIKTVIVEPDFNLFVPNAFTPNGDGVNDVFLPKGRGIDQYSLSIYNRWGDKLFESNDPAKGWDGQPNSKASDDAFIWTIKGIDAKGKVFEKTGHVMVVK